MFDQQGEMVARIAISIAQNTEAAEISRVERALTADMGAFDWYLRGLTEYRRAGLKIQHARVAAQCFDTALTLDPEFPRVLATRLCCMSWFDSDIYFDSKSDRDLSLALKIDDRDPEVHRMIGGIAAMKRQYEVAIHHVERAVHLNSSDAYLLSTAAGVLAWSGEERRALEHINRALTLDPFLPVWAIDEQIFVLYTLGDYDGALAAFRKLSIPASTPSSREVQHTF